MIKAFFKGVASGGAVGGLVFGLIVLLSMPPLSVVQRVAPMVARRSVVQEIESSSVSILVESSQYPGRRYYGSGVVFRQDGRTYVLTARHVVDEDPEMPDPTFKVVAYRSGQKEIWTARVVVSGPGVDLAVLRVDVGKRPLGGRDSLCLMDTKPRIGLRLLHIGNWLGFMPGSLSEGLLSNLDRVVEGEPYYQTTVTAYPGSSGGGVWTVDGRLAGILVRGAGENANLIVPVWQIRSWLREHRFRTD